MTACMFSCKQFFILYIKKPIEHSILTLKYRTISLFLRKMNLKNCELGKYILYLQHKQ